MDLRRVYKKETGRPVLTQHGRIPTEAYNKWIESKFHKLEQKNKELKKWMEERGHFYGCDLGDEPDSFDKRHYKCTCKLVELTEPPKDTN